MASLRFKVRAHEVGRLFQRPASWEEVWLQSSERNSRSDRKPLEKRVSEQSVKEKCGGEWRLKPELALCDSLAMNTGPPQPWNSSGTKGGSAVMLLDAPNHSTETPQKEVLSQDGGQPTRWLWRSWPPGVQPHLEWRLPW